MAMPDPKVGDLHRSIRLQEDIVAFQVMMHHSGPVHRRDSR